MKRFTPFAPLLGALILSASGCAALSGPKVKVLAGKETTQNVSAESAYHYLRAEMLSQDGEFAQALEEYEKAHKADPGSVHILLKLANAYLTVRDVAGAERAARLAIALDPADVRPHFFLGKIYYQTGREEEAIASFKSAVDAEPDNLEALLFYGLLLAENLHFDQAIPVLTRILEIRPNTDIVHFSLGKIYAAQKDWAKAEGHYRRTIEINPGFKAAYAELLKLYEESEQPDKAAALYKYLLAGIDPSDTRLRARLAELLLKQNKLDEAAGVYEEIKKNDPLNPRVMARLGLIYFEQERYADAVAQFQLYLAGDPSNDAVRYYLGRAYERLNKRDLARETLEQIPADSAVYIDAAMYLAFLDEQDEKLGDAIARMRAVLDTYPDNARVARMLGDQLRRAKKTDEAIAVLEQAIARTPGDPELYFSLGVVYDDKKNLEKTIAAMKKVLELDPDHAHALNYIGYTWADRGMNLDEAERMIRRALEIKPGDGYITDSLAWVYYRRGDLKQAGQLLEEAVRLAPEDAQIAAHLAEVYEKQNRLADALRVYEQALQLVREDEKLRAAIEQSLKAVRRQLANGNS